MEKEKLQVDINGSLLINKFLIWGFVAEQVDARDLKSLGGNSMLVRFQSDPPFKNILLVQWIEHQATDLKIRVRIL